MDRRVSILAAALVALLGSGACQDYNFNPVGHCLIQPGTRRVTLSNISTADVLFVVDDSGSMQSEQASLASNFSQFLDVLIATNQARAANPPLKPIDFHIAVTSTSVFYNPKAQEGSVCSDACPGATGSLVCCLKNASAALSNAQPPLCTADAECAAGYKCRGDCQGSGLIGGASACCLEAAPHAAQPIACPTAGEPCGLLDQYYYYDSVCDPPYDWPASPALRGFHYPQGAFMADTGNPKVLHFRRDLNWAGGASDPTIQPIAADFSQNVVVGTCGSPEEQGLEAGLLAVQKALRGSQSVPACPADWTPASTQDCWPHPNSKLVVVWVTDENDASSPMSAATGVVAFTPDNTSAEETARKYAVQRYADYFTSLGRPFGAAFVIGAMGTLPTDPPGTDPLACQDAVCNAAKCCTEPTSTNLCSGTESPPFRYAELAAMLRDRGVDVVVGSICYPFGTTLGRIGEIVKPPPGLDLPTLPADGAVTLLRISRSDGTTRKTCSGPAPAAPATFPGGISACSSELAGPWTEDNAGCYLGTLAQEWWFTRTADQVTALSRLPVALSQDIFINHAPKTCEANPGETYSADYIGQLPIGGCVSDQACADALGGNVGDWTCYAGVNAGGVCQKGSVTTPGTCLCGSPSKNACPAD